MAVPPTGQPIRARLVRAAVSGLLFLGAVAGAAEAQTGIAFESLVLTPTFECIGIRVRCLGDLEGNAAAGVRYRPSGTGEWKDAQPLNRIDVRRFAGSIFYLEPGTEYEVEINLSDPDGVSNGLRTGTTTTRAFDFPTGGREIYVATTGNDLTGTGSADNPFRTISRAHSLSRGGEEILVYPGVYRETVHITRSGGPGSYIAYRALGEGVILDGGDPVYEYGNGIDDWKPESGGVYSTSPGYATNYVGFDNQRLYRYESLSDLRNLPAGPPGGWYQDGSNKLYVKLSSGYDPDNHGMQVGKLNYGFHLTSAHHIIIDGFEMRYFGGDLRGYGIYLDSSYENVIQNCLIHGVLDGINLRRNTTENNLIQDNKLYDTSIIGWAWDDVKAHPEENAGISSSAGGGNVIRRNIIHGFFNGIAPAVWSDLAVEVYNHDMDIYENEVYDINDDCLEPEGTCINIRFWRNWLHDCLTPVSIAPITLGPCYIMRNVIFNYRYTAFKYNVDAPVTTRGPCLIYHNSICTPRDSTNGIEISGDTPIPWSYQRYRNNIVFATFYAIEEMRGPGPGLSFDYNAWFTTRPGSFIKWNSTRYYSIQEFRAATGFETHGLSGDPRFVDYQGGNLRLRANSPCIDAGQRLANINDDCVGSAPDMGAFEYGSTGIRDEKAAAASVPAFELLQNYPNPANPRTIIPFNLNRDGRVRLEIYNIRGQLVRRLLDGQMPAGSHKVLWDGKDDGGGEVPSGVYFYRISTENRSATRIIVLLK